MKNRITLKTILILNVIFCLYSVGGICSKHASGFPFLSFQFILFYGMEVLILLAYAVVWQQVLKITPLNLAYTNKAVTTIWSLIWGVVFFSEVITIGKLLGGILIISGVVLISYTPKEKGDAVNG